MTFQPVLPIGGYAGWKFLERTMEAQKTSFRRSPVVQRETDYFRVNIGKIKTAEALVADGTLLKIALGAFGLEGDLPNKAFIKKVLSDGTLTPGALSNRLADKRYREFSKAFGFGDFAVPRTQLSDFPERIAKTYETRQFEVAVGDQNEGMRLAMTAQRELAALSASNQTDTTKWLTVLGNPPLRRVFEAAFGLPSSFARVDLDTQIETMRDRADRTFGSRTINQFSDPEAREDLVRLYLLRSEVASAPTGMIRGSAALTLLQSSQSGSILSALIRS